MTACPACASVGSGPVCGTCGYVDQQPVYSQSLPSGALLANGRYMVEAFLGQGGFGITYLAFDQQLHRRVAIKEHFPEGCVRNGRDIVAPQTLAVDFQGAKEQFLREARLLAQVRHRNVVTVFDAFEDGSSAYLVMEHLTGEAYDTIVQRGPLAADDLYRLAAEMASALDELHRLQILHRDIKPANMIREPDGTSKLLDFGAARTFTSDASQTLSRIVSGGYSPLEQYAGRANFGPSSDLYSLAATLYHLATGVIPTAAVNRVQGEELIPLGRFRGDLQAPFVLAVVTSLALAKADRPQTVTNFTALLSGADVPPTTTSRIPLDTGAAALRATSAGPPVRKRRTAAVVTASFLAAAVVLVTVLLTRQTPDATIEANSSATRTTAVPPDTTASGGASTATPPTFTEAPLETATTAGPTSVTTPRTEPAATPAPTALATAAPPVRVYTTLRRIATAPPPDPQHAEAPSSSEASRMIQALVNAYADGDWNLVRSLNPHRRSWSNSRLDQTYGRLNAGRIEIRSQINSSRWRAIYATNEDDPKSGAISKVFCNPWEVIPGTGTVAELDNVLIAAAPGYNDLDSLIGRYSDRC